MEKIPHKCPVCGSQKFKKVTMSIFNEQGFRLLARCGRCGYELGEKPK